VHNVRSAVTTEVRVVGLSVIKFNRVPWVSSAPGGISSEHGFADCKMTSRVLPASSLRLPQEECNLLLWSKRMHCSTQCRGNHFGLGRTNPAASPGKIELYFNHVDTG
jgi:hypothetical protein